MHDIGNIATPFYLYDLDLLEKTISQAAMAASKHNFNLHYAIKANHESAIAACMREYGLGIDCVSGNEVRMALSEGFDAEKIVFAGVGKTDQDICHAIENDILALNAESVEELKVIHCLARSLGRRARVALRVNPGVDALTHQYITTGLDENKFGIPVGQLQSALDFCHCSEHIQFMGLHFHIGSQITSLQPYIGLCNRVNEIWKTCEVDRYGGCMLNLGGGLGIDYEEPGKNAVPDFSSFFSALSNHLNLPRHVRLHAELGRSLVGQCGSLITRVLFVKQGVRKKFVITDAGMTELMRPSLYQAKHHIDNLSSHSDKQFYDVVGPICESSDVFSRNISLPGTKRNDLLAIRSCGAYAQSMSLRYNLREEAPAVFLRGNHVLSYPEAVEQKVLGLV